MSENSKGEFAGKIVSRGVILFWYVMGYIS